MHIFTQLKKFYTLHCRILKSRCLKRWSFKHAQNELLLLSSSFTVQFELVSVLAHEKAFFSKRVHFQGNGKSTGSSKNGKRDFQNSPMFLRDRHTFMWQITRNFKRFQYFNFETNFLKTKNFFRKLEYCFLIEGTEIENPTFSYKTAPLKANFRTNRIGSTNELITKNRFLPVTNLIFWKFCFSWRV